MLTLCVISSPRNVLSLYGEVYFRAWRVASGAYLKVHNLLTLFYLKCVTSYSIQ